MHWKLQRGGGWSTGSSVCLTFLLHSHMLSARQGNEYHFKVFGMTWLGLEPMTYRLWGRHYTTGPSFCSFIYYNSLIAIRTTKVETGAMHLYDMILSPSGPQKFYLWAKCGPQAIGSPPWILHVNDYCSKCINNFEILITKGTIFMHSSTAR